MRELEINSMIMNSDEALLAWRGKEALGAGMGKFIEKLGLPPSEHVRDVIQLMLNFLDTAHDAAENHIELLKKLKNKEIILFRDKNYPTISTIFRSSVSGNSEGISTIEIRFGEGKNAKPVFHSRFMMIDVNGQPSLVITALQRYTDESLSTVVKPFFTSEELKRKKAGEDVKGILPLKEKNPARYKEYQSESHQITRLEKEFNTPFSAIAAVVCAALAKTLGDSKLYLTTYDNQYWVKVHDKMSDEIEIPDIYTSVADFFGLHKSSKLKGFYESQGDQIVFKNDSSAVSNVNISSIAQVAYQSYLNLLRRE